MDFLSPHSIVEIEGTRFDSWRGKDLIAASVELTTDKTGEGCVELFDPEFKILDGFLGGGIKALQAKFYLGWATDLGNPLFTGSLARVEWSDRITTLRFHDKSAQMKQQKKTRYFKKQTDLQILEKLAKDNNLKFVLNARISDGQPIDSLMQSGKTDWEMALKVAERVGLRLYVSDDTLYAVEAGTTQLSNSVATMIFEKDFTLLRNFNLSYKLPENKRGRNRRTEVRGRGKGGQRLTGTSETSAGTTNVIVNQDLPKQTIEMAEREARGRGNRRREYAFEHQLKTLSSFRKIISLRNTITLAGMGKFFSGNYSVTDIRYVFRPGELISELTVGADVK